MVKVLLDSGASASLITNTWAKKLKHHPAEQTNWTTSAGSFTTNQEAIVQIILPELHDKKTITFNCHIAPSLGAYDIIIGRDILRQLGIILNFNQDTIDWDDAIIPMKSEEATMEESFFVPDSSSLDEASQRIKNILDAKYDAADLNLIVNKCSHLTSFQKKDLFKLLTKYHSLFDGTLGKWKGEPYNIELKPDATPYHARPFPIPKCHEQTLKLEIQRLCDLGVLKKVNRSEWAAPTFIIPKKDGTVRFISDFRQLNQRIKRKPYPIPKIQDLLLKLEGFKYATSLDLNMGYYHISLTPFSKSLCTIVLPHGKYEYQRLPMGLCNSPDIFQERMSTLISDLEYCRAYIDDLLIISKGGWDQHLAHLETILQRLQQKGLKINANKSSFGSHEVEYLGYWISRQGIQPVAKKIQAVLALDVPKTRRELRRFIGMINYYRDMWIRRSDVLAPLTHLVSEKRKWEWTETQQQAFENIKQIISKETLLTYPDFTQPFEIHTDASHTQLGAVISQNNRPIAFYSRKLNPAQTRYTTTERELLAIVETLKEFRNILLGHIVKVYTDHKNLTYANFNTERVMRWRLILEEYGPELIYLPGDKNIVADALSRLSFNPNSANIIEHSQYAECFGATKEDLPSEFYPLKHSHLLRAQQADKTLHRLMQTSQNYHFKTFRGGEVERTLICYKDKIVIPNDLQKRMVQWYHDTLCHPGMTRTEQTIRQHFWWKTLREDVQQLCSTCDVCQKTKVTHTKYGHLPEKDAECEPWERLCVDMIGPYTIKRKGKKPLILWCVTMIDPATSWFEIKQVQNKEAYTVASVVEQTWLTRYPWPTIVVFDKGTEFMGDFARMVAKDYGIERKGITVRNPQANAIIERIHQTIGNIIRTFEIQNSNDLDEDDPWAGILSATMFAIRATFHTTLQATPAQLVFGRDAIMNTKFEANWHLIKTNKQKLIHINNKKENNKRLYHEYKVNDRVLSESKPSLAKFGQAIWEGPYVIVKINDNGTVRLRKGIVTETINIRKIKPYKGTTEP